LEENVQAIVRPFPFPFLTMTVSLEAIFLALFVLASQNRMAELAEPATASASTTDSGAESWNSPTS
jgi:uncharacterized membrane protein